MMRIAFITGCLEPGRDGVGDYTRDLAAACVRAGHGAMLVALNDRFVVDLPREQRQTARDVEVETLRLPATTAWTQRTAVARDWLATRRPDWVSLQFVPYAFHSKGIVTGLIRHLRPLVAGRLVHVMFHEIWIGAERGASLRHCLVGRLQRAPLLHTIRSLAPVIVHTSNPAYAAVLAAAAVPAGVLPLCGSIPVAPADPDWLPQQLLQKGVPMGRVTPRTDSWWFGLFGALHPDWNPEPLFTRIAEAAQTRQRGVVLAAIGRQGPGADLWRSLQDRYAKRFSFCSLGERSTREISWFLQGLDFGIATTPWQLIGKSATAAAMLDHGLPVIVSQDDIAFDGVTAQPSQPLLHRMDENLLRWLIDAPARTAPRDRLTDLTAQFLDDLAAVQR